MEHTKNHRRMIQKKEIAIQIKDLLKENPQGLSITEIVKEVNINRNTAGRYLENLLMSGQVEMRRLGMAKIYMLSQRVPLSSVLSISSELVIQLDSSLRVIFANEPFLALVGTDSKHLMGKNIEYTPVALVFDETFSAFIENIKEGSTGKEWSGEIELSTKGIVLFCRIAPTVFEDGRKGVSVIFEDITRRKKAERKIEESEERYRTLVEISPDAVIAHRDGKIFFMNPAALSLMGASHLDEMLGRNILDFIHPEFRDVVRENIQKDLIGDISPPIELNMVRVDGISIIVEGRGVKTNIEGKPAIQVALRDITDRKRAEEALKESEERYRTLAESSNDLIFVIDKDDRVEYANSFAAAMVNKPVNQIIGCPRSFLFPSDVAGTQKKALDRVFEMGTPVRSEGALTFNEQIYWFDHTLTPLKDADDCVRSVLGISRDITERRRAETALSESEEKYRTLVDRANDVICIIQDGVIKMCNFRLPEFWGGSVEEIIGKPISVFIHPDARSKIIEYYNRRMAGESPASIYETILMHKDGSRSYVELNAGIISYEGKIADLVIIRDINERKKAEEALRESEATARALLNAPTDSVILIDNQGKILALNEIAASRFGKQSADLVGIMSYDLLPEEVAQLRRSLMAPVLEKRESVRFADERAGRWYDTVAYPILNETGAVVKIAIVARDITEQKDLEKQLRKNEQMYKLLLEQSFDAIAIHKNGKIVFLNEKAAKILGAAKSEDLIGRSIFDFIHPDSRKDLEDRLLKLNSALGVPVPVMTEKFFRINGTTVTVEVMAIRFDDDGTPAFRVAFREISSL
jgi:PAS domain S-box-containing protein